MHFRNLLLCFVVSFPATLTAQCPTGPMFRFQLDEGARLLTRDTTLTLRPVPPRSEPEDELTVVRFVVDTAGLIEAESVRRSPGGDDDVFRAFVRTLGTWRFSPARLGTCRTREIVAMGLEFSAASVRP